MAVMHKVSEVRKHGGIQVWALEPTRPQTVLQQSKRTREMGWDGMGGHFAGSQYFLSIPSFRTAHSI